MADLTSKVISSNFQKLLQIEGDGVVQDGTGSVTPLRISGSSNIGIGTDPIGGTTLNIGGDIRASGDIIAENYVVSSSITYMTQSFSSGSTIFGDSTEDTHQFTGNISVTGSTAGHITASGNITASGKIIGNNFTFTQGGQINNEGGASVFQVKGNNDDNLIFTNLSGNDRIGIGQAPVSGKAKLQITGDASITSHITASANISSSANVISDKVVVGGASGSVDGINVAGDISASGDFYLTRDTNINFGINSGTRIYEDSSDLYIEADDDLYLRPDDNLVVAHATTNYVTFEGDERRVRVSGDISASGNLYVSGAFFGDQSDPSRIIHTSNDLTISSSDDLILKQDDIGIQTHGGGNWVTFDGGNNRVGIGTSTPESLLTVEGDISASGKIFEGTNYIQVKTAGNDFRLQSEGGGDVILHSERDWKFEDSSDRRTDWS